MFDPLGDAMKDMERAYARAPIPRDKLIYGRVDGVGFSKFTRGMVKPFDLRMSRAMMMTTQRLMERTGAKAAYVQSDEISLVWETAPEVGEHWYGGRPDKFVSVLAAAATQYFNGAICDPEIGLADFADREPMFDARIEPLDTRAQAAEKITWRGQDARRNAITMIAQSRYSHKSLQGVSSMQMREKLAADGIDVTSFPEVALNGCLYCLGSAMLPLDEETRMKIPEFKRPEPGHLFERRTLRYAMHKHPGQMPNLEQIIFEGAPFEEYVPSEDPEVNAVMAEIFGS